MVSGEILGTLAAILTTVAFIPQVVQVWKTKQTKDISLGMFSLFSVGVFLWFLYGIVLMKWPMIIANGIVFILASIILGFKIKYK